MPAKANRLMPVSDRPPARVAANTPSSTASTALSAKLASISLAVSASAGSRTMSTGC